MAICKAVPFSQYIKDSILVSTQNTDTGTMRKWPTQVGTVVANIGMELSLLKMAINMANADYLSFFSMERTGASVGSGVPGVIQRAILESVYIQYRVNIGSNVRLQVG